MARHDGAVPELHDRRGAALRLAALVLAVAVVFGLVALLIPHSAQEVRERVDALGALAPVAYVALSAALTLALFPFPVLAAAAGLLFGTAAGTGLSLLAALAGASLAFVIAKRWGAGPVEVLARGRVRQLLDLVERRGFVAVLYLRIVPGVPRDVANYGAGLTAVGFVPYFAATALGTAPRAYAYTALGSSFALGNLDSPEAIAAVAALAGMAALGLGLLAWERRRARREPPDPGTGPTVHAPVSDER